MEKKLKDKIVEQITWSKGVQGGWVGSVILPDGYGCSIVATPNMKMRDAKSMIREKLVERVLELLAERNLTIK